MVPGLRHIHMIAIGGVGMSSLAALLRQSGFDVTGSDREIHPPASTLLERLGVSVQTGFHPDNLDPPPDLVIVGNAVSRTNPEVEALLQRNVPYASMPAAFRRFFLAGRRSVVVAGTHGKSTSTAMLAWTLLQAGRDPGLMLGAESIDFDGNCRVGSGELFVVEGDEYDTAFFDKEPKFFHYDPQALLLTSIEFDHADIYRDLDHVRAQFVRLLERLPADAPVVACKDFPEVRNALRQASREAFSFGLDGEADWLARDVRDEAGRTFFRVTRRGETEATLGILPMGPMNVRNALGVFALCRGLGLSPDEIRSGLESFRGVRRRQEILVDGDVVVIDDFAHHPTAVSGTIEAVRARYPERRLWAVFEPRSNTSRRRIFQEEYADALARADLSVVAAVYPKDTDRLDEAERLSVPALIEELAKRGRSARTFQDPGEILHHLRSGLRHGDVVVFMSNGTFGDIPRAFARGINASTTKRPYQATEARTGGSTARSP